MQFQERIEGFVYLGDVIREYLARGEVRESARTGLSSHAGILGRAVAEAGMENPWFTKANIRYALGSLAGFLSPEALDDWLKPYLPQLAQEKEPLTVAVVMAGNIPAVGFHDFLSVLISGNRFLGKLSSDDRKLLPAFGGILSDSNPAWESFIGFTSGRIGNFDAVIATGSNNTSGYFDYYFSKHAHIIRKNRNGVAVLTGEETEEELSDLVTDVVSYFGLGCRNVSKIYVPEGYDFSRLLKAASSRMDLIDHHKYNNNCIYFRVIYQMNQVPFMDAGCLLLKEEKTISSPISVLHYAYYKDWKELTADLGSVSDFVQCIICRKEAPYRWCLPGNSQKPGLSDYADGVDTMHFLLSL